MTTEIEAEMEWLEKRIKELEKSPSKEEPFMVGMIRAFGEVLRYHKEGRFRGIATRLDNEGGKRLAKDLKESRDSGEYEDFK